jgi:PAS domain S-box-containing protein
MKKSQDQPADALRAAGPTGRSAAELHRRAEERLKRQRPEGGGQRTDVETARLVHEPQVNQIELEMQNEKLQQARAQVGALMAQYIDLFDFAPMGYLTLDREGAIRQVNLNGARLFGVERSRLLKRRFGLFVAEGDRRAFSDFLEKVFASEAKECCEVTLPQEGSQPLVVHIEATCSADGQECHAAVLDMTERKRTEEALRWSETELRAILESTADGILAVDNHGKVIQANRRFAELWRIPQALLEIGDDRAMLDFVLGQLCDPDAFLKKVQSLYDSDAVDMETLAFKDGRIFERFSEPLMMESAIKGRVWSFRDISERKRAEEALKKSAQFLRDAGAMAKVGGWELDLSTKEVSWTEEVCRIHGVEPGCRPKMEEALSFYAPEFRPALEVALKKAAATGEPYDLESLLIPRGSKDKIWVRSLGRAVYSGGKIVKLAGTFQNIDKYKRAETALRVSLEKYRVLFESFPLGISVTDVAGNLIEANRESERLLGVPRDEHAQRKYDGLEWLIVRPDGTPMPSDEYASVRALRERRLVENVEMGIVKAGGEITWISVTAAPIPIEGYGVAIAYGDITERKRAEERIRMFSREIIAAREEERKQVSSVLHHDVGSLAVGIAAHLDAIEGDLRSGKPGEALQWTKRTRKLFDESVVRLKKLAIELRPPELDVLGLRAALRQHFAQVTERGGTRIHFRATLGRRRVSGDTATILFRIAQESLTNAITHAHATQVDVNLRTSKKEVRLMVRNNGKGFDLSEHRERATSQIGLHVMREMAAAVGGAFTIDSKRGKRTTVRVSLPLKTAVLGPGDVTAREETVARGKTTRSAGRGSRPQKGSRA